MPESKEEAGSEVINFEAATMVVVERTGGRRIRRVLNRDKWMRQAHTQMLVEKWEDDQSRGVVTAAAEEGDGPFISFIKWLVENQDSVIAFFEKLIGLFAGISTAEAA